MACRLIGVNPLVTPMMASDCLLKTLKHRNKFQLFQNQVINIIIQKISLLSAECRPSCVGFNMF